MNNISKRIEAVNWQSVTEAMKSNGYAVVPGLVTKEECDMLIQNYGDADSYRKTVIMERHRFGLGEYKYFSYPLPLIIQELRQLVYPKLAPIANNWMRALNIQTVFPDTFAGLRQTYSPDPEIWAGRVQYIAPGSVWRHLLPHAAGYIFKRARRRLYRR